MWTDARTVRLLRAILTGLTVVGVGLTALALVGGVWYWLYGGS